MHMHAHLLCNRPKMMAQQLWRCNQCFLKWPSHVFYNTTGYLTCTLLGRVPPQELSSRTCGLLTGNLAGARTEATSTSSSISSHSSWSTGSPTMLAHTLCHMPFFCNRARPMTAGKCQTLAQNSPRALPLWPSKRWNLSASLTSHKFTGRLVAANVHSVTP